MADQAVPTTTNEIEKFVEILIDQRGFTDLTPEVREEIKKDILFRLNDFTMARIIAAFSDEDVLTFEQMLKDNKTQEELQNFSAEHISDFTSFLTNVLLEFQDVYLGRIQTPTIINDLPEENTPQENATS